MEVEIIYSDEDLIVINKPSGLPVHGGPQVRGKTLVDFLSEKFPEIKNVGDSLVMSNVKCQRSNVIFRPGIVHRLDKDTSGVMVVARNQKSFEYLKNLFKTRQVEKTYWAIVCGAPKERRGIISFPIGRLVRNPLKRGADLGKGGIRGAREAITEYKVLKAGEKYSLVELKPKTGRMHQIRVHLKALGHPVACDRIHGGKNVCCPAGASRPAEGEARPTTGRQLLHAKSLSFSFPAHEVGEARPDGRPEGRRLYFEADPPEDFAIAGDKIM